MHHDAEGLMVQLVKLALDEKGLVISRMRAGGLFVAFSLTALGWPIANARADPLAPPEALKHVGEVATICGLVASTNYIPQATGAPTFLDFDSAYPKATFTALILGRDREKFGTPEMALQGKQVCVTGEIQIHGGRAEVILT